MKIVISDEKQIRTIQKEFNDEFPYLKIEFFSKPHTSAGESGKKYIKNHSETLANCRNIHESGNITITENMTVDNLEQVFQDVYGLSVQVFRKSGSTWLQTTVTDNWTLKKQNDEGRELSESKKLD